MSETLFGHPFAHREADARAAEAFETPQWAVEAILDCEILTPRVLDPCCGHGTLAKAARARGYTVVAQDLYEWGFGRTGIDFFDYSIPDPTNLTILMNPPFSRAVEFVERAVRHNVRKIIAFQRFAWWESMQRNPFWRANPPARVHCCISRADCWRFDIPPEKRGSGTPTAHAWFVWERGHPSGPMLGRLMKE